MRHWRQETLDKINAVDVDKLRDECKADSKREDPETYDSTYPRLCGSLQYWLGEATTTANGLMEELQEKLRRIHALEWAAETVLNDTEVSTYDRSEVYELLYNAADIIEQAIKDGMTDDDLRKHLKDGLQDDELEKGRLIKPEERCTCGEFCGDEPMCEDCAYENSSA